MKIIYPFLIVLIGIGACSDNGFYIEPLKPITVCSVNNPLNDLKWLHSKIVNPENNMNPVEFVWVKSYNEKDIIVIRNLVSSVAYASYNCSGENVIISDITFYNNLSEADLIYKYH